jgi:hypothetical protein
MILKGIVTAARFGAQAAKVIGAITDAKGEIVALWVDARQKWDSDGDGKPDVKPQEAVEFLGKAFSVIAKRM